MARSVSDYVSIICKQAGHISELAIYPNMQRVQPILKSKYQHCKMIKIFLKKKEFFLLLKLFKMINSLVLELLLMHIMFLRLIFNYLFLRLSCIH